MNKLLIVEDDQDLLEGLAFSMESEGYQVICASTMEEGLKKFRDHLLSKYKKYQMPSAFH